MSEQGVAIDCGVKEIRLYSRGRLSPEVSMWDVVVEGKVRFCAPDWDASIRYRSRVVENPDWYDVLHLADDFLGSARSFIETYTGTDPALLDVSLVGVDVMEGAVDDPTNPDIKTAAFVIKGL